MMKETEEIVLMDLDFLPLKTSANIVEGNALRMDWNDVVDKNKLNYIMGNPPFVGYGLQSVSQKVDILSLYVDEKGKPYNTAGKIDYVAGWYWKASDLMQGTSIRSALVSANSITQGEQVTSIWKPLYDRFGIHIDFAHKTFIWDSEASTKAHVHCVIIGFSVVANEKKRILYSDDHMVLAKNINPYLADTDIVFIEGRKKPLCEVPEMSVGNRPTDAGQLILSSEEKEDLLKVEPQASRFIKKYMMGYEFINKKDRYCLWLVNASPSDIRSLTKVRERVEKCREARFKSLDEGRRKLADTPHLFREQLNPILAIVIPKVSSERRRYIPMGFLDQDTIAGDNLFVIPDASLYHFGILTSNVHMAWMRTVGGRLKSDYRYSKDLVYNTFPWPSPTEEQRKKIEQTAQEILDARALFPDSSLADLYDEVTMPQELRKAHQRNDRAVMDAYGIPTKDFLESDCVAELMKFYQRMTKE